MNIFQYFSGVFQLNEFLSVGLTSAICAIETDVKFIGDRRDRPRQTKTIERERSPRQNYLSILSANGLVSIARVCLYRFAIRTRVPEVTQLREEKLLSTSKGN